MPLSPNMRAVLNTLHNAPHGRLKLPIFWQRMRSLYVTATTVAALKRRDLIIRYEEGVTTFYAITDAGSAALLATEPSR